MKNGCLDFSIPLAFGYVVILELCTVYLHVYVDCQSQRYGIICDYLNNTISEINEMYITSKTVYYVYTRSYT